MPPRDLSARASSRSSEGEALMPRERELEDRTEEPTPRRREEARRVGNVPRSAGLVLALALLAAFGSLAWMGPAAAASIRSLFDDLLAQTGRPGLDMDRASALLSSTAAALGIALLPWIGLCFGGALVAGACRGGAGFHPGAVGLAWSRSARGAGFGGGAIGAVERTAALAIAAPLFVAGAAAAFEAAAEALARGGVGPAALALGERIP